MNDIFLLDSGAFSVWNSGETIDLNAYIQFCVENPGCSYFVNLDVIPGKPNDVKSMTDEIIEASCKKGRDNYHQMLRHLPGEKVIPVFHQSDSFKWLERYIDFGAPYVGISPGNDRTTDQKMGWLMEVKKIICNSQGQPVIKTHGFAVTSFRLMKAFPWFSVDSASWVRQAAYGTIYVPHLRKDGFIYDVSPFLLSMSPKSPSREERQAHITTLSPTVKAQVDRYLSELKMSVGKFEVVDVERGYKKKDDELWWEKGKKNKVMRILERGLMTAHQQRFWANMKFIQRANEALDLEHIFFAGADGSLLPQIEFRLKRRLMSYHSIMSSKAAREVFGQYMERAGSTARVA